MKKSVKFILAILCMFACTMVFAGSDNLISLGVPSFVCEFAVPTGVMVAPIFAVTPQETGIVIAYKNKDLIADEVMPVKKLDGPELTFEWYERTLGDAFTNQDTRVGRMSRPNTIYFDGETRSGYAKAYGLETPVPFEDLDRIKNKQLFLGATSEDLTNRVLLDREVRVAAIVQNSANYLASQAITVPDSQKIGASGADVYNLILQYLEDALVRPNVLGMSSKVWMKLRSDPSVIAALYPNGNGKGAATREQLAELFEVERLIIGKARINTNRNPKSPVLQPCWGPHIWGHYYEPMSTLKSGLAWGMTAQVGERILEVNEDKSIGLKGGEIIKAGFYQDEVVTAKGAGILLKDILV